MATPHDLDQLSKLAAAIVKARAIVGKADTATSDLPSTSTGAPAKKKPPKFRRTTYQGIPITVDRPQGYEQTGKDALGRSWSRKYLVDYGFVPKTKGGDGEGLDVFLGPEASARQAFWIVQRNEDGAFDEFKLMLGFDSARDAKSMYLAHIPARFYGGITPMDLGMVKALLGIEPIEIGKALIELASVIVASQDSIVEEILSTPTAKDAAPPTIDTPTGDRSILRIIQKAEAPAESSELRYVLGIVLEPETTDSQGDIYSADEIRKSAWIYMEEFRNVGLMHKGLINGKARIVESYIAPADFELAGSKIMAGTWLMGFHVADDELWAKVKEGELTGLSIGGFAKRTEVDSET